MFISTSSAKDSYWCDTSFHHFFSLIFLLLMLFPSVDVELSFVHLTNRLNGDIAIYYCVFISIVLVLNAWVHWRQCKIVLRNTDDNRRSCKCEHYMCELNDKHLFYNYRYIVFVFALEYSTNMKKEIYVLCHLCVFVCMWT